MGAWWEVGDGGSGFLPGSDCIWRGSVPKACEFSHPGALAEGKSIPLGYSLSPVDSGPECLENASTCCIRGLTLALNASSHCLGLSFPSHEVSGPSMPSLFIGLWPLLPSPGLRVGWGKGKPKFPMTPLNPTYPERDLGAGW
jgi:hypothetical protein